MLNDLHNLRHEANKVSHDRATAHHDYLNLKNVINQGSIGTANFNSVNVTKSVVDPNMNMPKYNMSRSQMRRSGGSFRKSVRIAADHNIGSSMLRSE